MIRLDPCPSKVFTWLEHDGDKLRVRYRWGGNEWEFWPVTEEEAKAVMNPSQKYGFSVGSAFGQIIKPYKNGRKLGSDQPEPKPEPKRRVIA